MKKAKGSAANNRITELLKLFRPYVSADDTGTFGLHELSGQAYNDALRRFLLMVADRIQEDLDGAITKAIP